MILVMFANYNVLIQFTQDVDDRALKMLLCPTLSDFQSARSICKNSKSATATHNLLTIALCRTSMLIHNSLLRELWYFLHRTFQEKIPTNMLSAFMAHQSYISQRLGVANMSMTISRADDTDSFDVSTLQDFLDAMTSMDGISLFSPGINRSKLESEDRISAFTLKVNFILDFHLMVHCQVRVVCTSCCSSSTTNYLLPQSTRFEQHLQDFSDADLFANASGYSVIGFESKVSTHIFPRPGSFPVDATIPTDSTLRFPDDARTVNITIFQHTEQHPERNTNRTGQGHLYTPKGVERDPQHPDVLNITCARMVRVKITPELMTAREAFVSQFIESKLPPNRIHLHVMLEAWMNYSSSQVSAILHDMHILVRTYC